MATLRDGLGFEELGDVGDPAEKTAQLFLTGSVTAGAQISGLNIFAQFSGLAPRIVGTNVIGTTDVSGLNVFATESGTFGRVVDTSGAMFSISVGSETASVHGPKIQIGSCITTATGFGSCIFESLFTDARYWWNATASSGGTFLAINAGSIVPMVSGILGLNPSGVTFRGAPSTPYSWVAIGL